MEAGLPRQHAHHRQSLSDVHTPIPQNGPVPIPQGGHAPPGLNGVNGGGPIPQGGHASLGHNGMNGGGFGYVQRGGHMNNNGTQLGRSPPQAQAKNTAHVPCKFFKCAPTPSQISPVTLTLSFPQSRQLSSRERMSFFSCSRRPERARAVQVFCQRSA